MVKNNSPTVREVFMNENIAEFVKESPALVELMFKCLEVDVKKRITIEQLVEELSKLTNISKKLSNSSTNSITSNFSNLKLSEVDEDLFSTKGGYPRLNAYTDDDQAKSILSSSISNIQKPTEQQGAYTNEDTPKEILSSSISISNVQKQTAELGEYTNEDTPKEILSSSISLSNVQKQTEELGEYTNEDTPKDISDKK